LKIQYFSQYFKKQCEKSVLWM